MARACRCRSRSARSQACWAADSCARKTLPQRGSCAGVPGRSGGCSGRRAHRSCCRGVEIAGGARPGCGTGVSPAAVRCIRHRHGRVEIVVAGNDPPGQPGPVEEARPRAKSACTRDAGRPLSTRLAQMDETVQALAPQGLDPGPEHPKGLVQVLGAGLVGDQADAHRGPAAAPGRGRKSRRSSSARSAGRKQRRERASRDRARPAGGRQGDRPPGRER